MALLDTGFLLAVLNIQHILTVDRRHFQLFRPNIAPIL